jgi:hypothetical protein
LALGGAMALLFAWGWRYAAALAGARAPMWAAGHG